jgi:hypothetical protein
MMCGTCYQQVLSDISELGVWASPFINIGDAHDLPCDEFEFYRRVFKEKYEKEQEYKVDIIKKAFEFAGQCTNTICKTISKVFSSMG